LLLLLLLLVLVTAPLLVAPSIGMLTLLPPVPWLPGPDGTALLLVLLLLLRLSFCL
jgi:hypothetical protein